ncbi:WbqC family protein [Flavihumibacter rivuli]|uniref:WbqC family protein n=1 Tax=Flavihumibacter rivuli TaxID=2838156 RepID=UPI001BDE0493|nr:WbqC family protein [Flavihumibacter rivuli]ULQ57905.1 WbqC family protein [Flavihumibacter rivuli]
MSGNLKNTLSLNIDLQYFASVNWFKKAVKYKYLNIIIYVPHEKVSFRNRCWLGSGHGLMRLSIPLISGRDQRTPYGKIRTAGGRWKVEHWRGIVSCYNRSPWFEHYRDELAALFEQPTESLVEWNLSGLQWVNRQLGGIWEMNVVDSPAIDGALSPEALRQVAGEFLPNNQASWLETYPVQRYPQVFEERNGFLPGLSILDLLFCMGPKKTLEILKNE